MGTAKTVMASEVAKRIADLVAEHGDGPIFFMEPMSGAALPMSAPAIAVNEGRIEVWPAD